MSTLTKLNPGDICWVEVPFTPNPGSKVRPAVISAADDDTIRIWPIFTKPGRTRLPIPANANTGLHHDSFVDKRPMVLPASNVRGFIGRLGGTR